jgi:hypothetical protein
VNTNNLDMLADDNGMLVTVVNDKFDLHQPHFTLLSMWFMVSYLIYCYTALEVCIHTHTHTHTHTCTWALVDLKASFDDNCTALSSIGNSESPLACATAWRHSLTAVL